MNTITHSISRLTSFYPLTRNETALTAGIGIGLAITNGATIAGITVIATVALKYIAQTLARRYLKRLSPTRNEIEENYKKLEKLRFDIVDQKIRVASSTHHSWVNLKERCSSLEKENLTYQQRVVLNRFSHAIDELSQMQIPADFSASAWRETVLAQDGGPGGAIEDLSRPVSEWVF